jgi:hypothetical protein
MCPFQRQRGCKEIWYSQSDRQSSPGSLSSVGLDNTLVMYDYGVYTKMEDKV